jgi:CRISPR-associated endonuclease Csn1
MGVRIYSDGRDAKSGKSLAEDRRLARQARRRRDRFLKRRGELLKALVRHGLMPLDTHARKALEMLDPYSLRARALDERIEPYELGRVFFHLNQRRGFKSNRKTDKGQDTGKIRPAIARLQEALQESGSRTLGEYLHRCRTAKGTIRFRPVKKGVGVDYGFYPQRCFAEAEFDAIAAKQRLFHSGLDHAVEGPGGLRDIIFHQRPLKPVLPGKCTLNPMEPRAPKALPMAQRFRILQDLNHLRVVSPDMDRRPLTLAERDKLFAILEGGKDLTFDQVRSKLGLPGEFSFTLDTTAREGLKGDATARILSNKRLFGPAWLIMNRDMREHVAEKLLETEEEEELVGLLMAECGVGAEKALGIARVCLPDGYGRFSRSVLKALCEQMEMEVIPYNEAVVRAGFASHSDFYTGEVHDRLPYYGVVLQRYIMPGSGNHTDKQEERLGRISNPTVHITLNQLRKVVNELIKDHGPPSEVILEVARDLKNGPDTRRAIQKRQAKLKDARDARRKRLEEMNVKDTRDSLLRLRLWEELGRDEAARRCPYTGEAISIARLLSDEVEIDHILPFGRSLDDSPANMTVCMRRANRYKLNRAPFEAFGESPAGYDWTGILERAALLPENKRWRFAPDAMQQLERDRDFLDRQLSDTQYIACLAREYMTCVCDKNKVWVTPGRLTGLLAHAWGFPRKNREDHRHHARDAALIGVCNRSLLKKAAEHNAREVETGAGRLLAGFDQPWPTFREDVQRALEGVVVSHRPDHGVGGRLHNATAYGVLDPAPGAKNNAQHRVPVDSLAKPEDLLKIKSRGIRAMLLAALTGNSFKECLDALRRLETRPEKEAKTGVAEYCGAPGERRFRQVVAEYAEKRGVRRVRLVETLTLIPIKDGGGRIYKGFKGDANAYFPIYANPDGTWSGEIVSTFEANASKKMPSDGGPLLVTRLFKGDMLEITHAGRKMYVTIVRLSGEQIAMAEHFQADVDKRAREKKDGFSLIFKGSPEALRKSGARPLYVSPTGKVTYTKAPRHADTGDSRE